MSQLKFSKDFILVAAGQIVSIFGNQILRYALPLYLLNQTGSAALFGTILACSFIPMLLLYPVGGIIADRVNKRNIMVVLDFATAGLVFLFYVLVGVLDIVPLMAATMMFLYGIQGAYQPAVQASVPVLVREDQIMQANSIVNLINSVASMAGPVSGGVLFALVGLTPILYVSMGCFFASAVMELFIRIPHEKKPVQGNLLAIGFADLRDSFRFVFRKQPVLWKICLTYAAVNLLLVPLLLISVPVLITQHLGFAPETANLFYGYSQGVLAGGSVLGGLLAGVFAKRLKLSKSPLLLGGCGLTVLLGGIALQLSSNSLAIYLALLVSCGLLTALSTLFQIQVMSYIQVRTPKELTGKVISCVICVCMCTSPLGQFLYGILFETISSGFYLPFYIAALLMVAISVLTRGIFAGILEMP